MKTLTPMRRIRLKCLDCMCGSAFEVKMCIDEDCVLWPVRSGRKVSKGPARTRTPKQEEALRKLVESTRKRAKQGIIKGATSQ